MYYQKTGHEQVIKQDCVETRAQKNLKDVGMAVIKKVQKQVIHVLQHNALSYATIP